MRHAAETASALSRRAIFGVSVTFLLGRPLLIAPVLLYECPTIRCLKTRIGVARRSDSHRPTIDYIERRIQEGKSRREATRCLKRYLARNLYRLLETSPPKA